MKPIKIALKQTFQVKAFTPMTLEIESEIQEGDNLADCFKELAKQIAQSYLDSKQTMQEEFKKLNNKI
jgi:hypothetical protein